MRKLTSGIVAAAVLRPQPAGDLACRPVRGHQGPLAEGAGARLRLPAGGQAAQTTSCGALDLSAAKRVAMSGMADAFADGGQAASTSVGAYFIDMRGQFSGQLACGTDPWINGVDLAHGTEIFHPNLAASRRVPPVGGPVLPDEP